jgi:predicted transcriptional regulator
VVAQFCLEVAACWAFVEHQDRERLDIFIEMQKRVSSALVTANRVPYRDIIVVIKEITFTLFQYE